MLFNPFNPLLRGQATIISTLKELKKIMADSTTQTNASFADVQAAITQIVNDNTAQNNAVAAQIKEVQTLIMDFAAQSQTGDGPSQADFQNAMAQLQSVHSLVQQNTAAVQASSAAVTAADPNAAGTNTGIGVDQGTNPVNQTPAGGATVGENTSSGVGSQPNSTLG